MVLLVELPLVSLILFSVFAIFALFISTNYTLATWTSSAILFALVVFALWKFSVLPHMTLLLPVLVLTLILGIVADVGFKYFNDETEVPGTTIVASASLLLLGFGYFRGWF